MKIVCSCIFCREIRPVKGIHTHVDRSHLGITKYSNGHNGRYRDDSYKNKIKQTVKEKNNKIFGSFNNFAVKCDKCHSKFFVVEREKQFPKKEKYFCSRSCANSHSVSAAHRKKVSEALTGRVYVQPTEVNTHCLACGKNFTYTKTNASREKRFCSRTCGTLWGRRALIEKTRAQRPALINYRADCAFAFNLKDYPEEFDFSLVEQHGWYSAANRGNNLTGVSRDHMVSIRYGFDNTISAAHIGHPANCRLLTHSANVSKGTKNHITYEELLHRIAAWDQKYKQ